MLPLEVQLNRMRAKQLGQNFLVNPEIAKAEAVHGEGKNVLEIGPGYGILTKELCQIANSVVAVEKDSIIYSLLKREMKQKNLTLINKDFFETTDEELNVDKMHIMISNIPYNLSSKVIEWLANHKMEAVLCLQKEFVEHMLAKPNTRKYSKLSVVSSLLFSIKKIMAVSKGNFVPMPKVNSTVIYMKPKDAKISKEELRILSLLMEHKKKTLRNALIDSSSYLNIGKQQLAGMAEKLPEKEERVFKLPPEKIVEIAREIEKLLSA